MGSELDSSTEGVTGLLADTCEFYYMGSWVFELTRFYIRYIHIPRVICSTSRINWVSNVYETSCSLPISLSSLYSRGPLSSEKERGTLAF